MSREEISRKEGSCEEIKRDYSMLDLFRQEVATQVTDLKQSLAILKQQPSLIGELETALRSLHTIFGAAQIVEIAAAATLVQTMQANLVALQNRSVALTETGIDLLLDATDLLIEISQATELDRWLSDHQQDLTDTQDAISEPVSKVKGELEVSQEPESPSPLAPLALSGRGEPEEDTPNMLTENSFQAAIVDSSLLALFRLEVESQAAVLNNGLLALESQPQSAQELEALMRAAHSIKGAARIVGLDAAVNLAHVMEDCFVAAQNQAIVLTDDRIDVLLRGVDLLQSLGQVSDRDLSNWFARHDAEIATTVDHIAALQTPEAVLQTPEAVPQSEPIPDPLPLVVEAIAVSPPAPIRVEPAAERVQIIPSVKQPDRASDRVVRVSAENLNRMMGLAGESLIEANWLPPFADSLLAVKSRQIELAKHLETLQQHLLLNAAQDVKTLLDTARRKEQECRNLLSDRLAELEEFIRRNANLSDRLYREVITSNMRPFADGVQSFPRMVRDIARELNKQVKLEIVGKSTSVDRDILIKLEAPLTHILRNAVDHGLESPEDRTAAGKPAAGRICLEAAHRGGMLAITVSDDGRGIAPRVLRQQVIDRQLSPPEVVAKLSDLELMEFLFLPGFSLAKQVTELSGRGVGLDIAKSMVQEVGGTVRATSQPGKGTSFHFQLPLTLSVVRTLLVEVSGEAYAFPLARIDQIVSIPKSEIAVAENRQYFTLDQKNVGLIPLHQVLDLPPPTVNSDALWIVVISDHSNTYGLVIDRCLGERELVVRPLDPRLGKVQDVSAAALMGDGSLVIIVDVLDLVRSVNTLLNTQQLTKVGEDTTMLRDQKRVLVVDDSITVREMERKLLQNCGYRVDLAVDGMEGWNAVRSQPYDLVISDIDMPRMNGIELIKQIKRHPRLNSIPVIVVSYRDREDDRMQGLEAGADYYLTKSSFHDDTLLRAVMDLIGE